MPYLRNKLFTPFLLVVLIQTAFGSDPLTMLQRNRFFKAIEGWEKEATSGNPTESKLRAIKGQAIAYSRLGFLYKDFNKLSLELSEEFFKKISQNVNSPVLALYQGQVAFYQGNYSTATKYLEKALGGNPPSETEHMAKVFRHYALQKLNKTRGNIALKTDHNKVKWQILESGGTSSIPGDLSAEDVRSLRCKLSLLVSEGKASAQEISKLIATLIPKSEFPEVYINKGKLTQINFYDPNINATLAKAYFYLAKLKNQELIEDGEQFPNLAKKFNSEYSLAEVLFELEDFDGAEKYLKSDDSKKGLILMAKIKAAQNQPAEAKKLLAKALKEGKSSPEAMRDVGYAYFETGVDKKKGEKLTEQAAKGQKSSSYFQKYGAVLYGMGKQMDALEIYGKGYKIQFRNSVDHIDPNYMIDYAFTIFKTSKLRYDEVIETLFHIDKAYPACRHLHYTMQGIAAAEANTGSGEKIIRKGG